jgi:hypothetical protein
MSDQIDCSALSDQTPMIGMVVPVLQTAPFVCMSQSAYNNTQLIVTYNKPCTPLPSMSMPLEHSYVASQPATIHRAPFLLKELTTLDLKTALEMLFLVF